MAEVSNVPIQIQWAREGRHGKFDEADKELPTYRDSYGNSVLSVAAIYGHVKTCDKIMKICPSLLYNTNNEGSTALHHAASQNKLQTLNSLILKASPQSDTENIPHPLRENLLRMANYENRTALHWAAESGHSKAVKALIQADNKDTDKNGKLLTMEDQDHRTALHLAAQGGHEGAVQALIDEDGGGELLQILDKDERSALHLAAESGHLNAVQAIIKADKKGVLRMMPDTKGDTALHLAVQKQLKETVEALAAAKPSMEYCANNSDETPHFIAFDKVLNGEPKAGDIFKIILPCGERNNDGQNFLHVLAARRAHAEVRYSLGLNDMAPIILNQKDHNKKTPLHRAVAANNENLARALLYHKDVNQNDKNQVAAAITFKYEKKKAGTFGLSQEDHVEIIAELYKTRVKDQADIDLVVATLIATVSFAAGIAVPGGYTGEGSNLGTAVLAPKTSFKVFMLSDVLALLLSLHAALSHLAAKHIRDENAMLSQVKIARCCSILAIFAMVAAFASGLYVVLAATNEFAIILCALCSSFIIFALLPLYRVCDVKNIVSKWNKDKSSPQPESNTASNQATSSSIYQVHKTTA